MNFEHIILNSKSDDFQYSLILNFELVNINWKLIQLLIIEDFWKLKKKCIKLKIGQNSIFKIWKSKKLIWPLGTNKQGTRTGQDGRHELRIKVSFNFQIKIDMEKDIFAHFNFYLKIGNFFLFSTTNFIEKLKFENPFFMF